MGKLGSPCWRRCFKNIREKICNCADPISSDLQREQRKKGKQVTERGKGGPAGKQ